MEARVIFFSRVLRCALLCRTTRACCCGAATRARQRQYDGKWEASCMGRLGESYEVTNSAGTSGAWSRRYGLAHTQERI